jgi:hypothetical protein
VLAEDHELQQSHRRLSRVSRQPIQRTSGSTSCTLRSERLLKNSPANLRNGPLIGFPGRTSLKPRGQGLNM